MDKYTEVGKIEVGGNPTDLAVYSNKIYVANYSQDMSIVDTISSSVIGTIPTGSGTISVDVDATITHAYALNIFSNKVHIIDISDDTIVSNIDILDGAIKLVTDSHYHKTYVINPVEKSLTIIRYKKQDNRKNWYIDNIINYDRSPIDIALNNTNHKISIVFDPIDYVIDPDTKIILSTTVRDIPIKNIESNDYSSTDISNIQNRKISVLDDSIILTKVINITAETNRLESSLQILDLNFNPIVTYSNIADSIDYAQIKKDTNDRIVILNNLNNKISILDGNSLGVTPPIIDAISVGQNPVALVFAQGVLPTPTPTITSTTSPTPTVTTSLSPTPTLTSTLTPTATVTNTPTISVTSSQTPTATPTITPTASTVIPSCLITNGSFSNNTNGWTTNNIDYLKFGTLPEHYAVDLNSCSEGYIYQTVQTIPGTEYSLRFNYSGNNYTRPDNTTFIKTFSVSITNSSDFTFKNYSFDISPFMKYYTLLIGPTYEDMGWQYDTITFTASSTSSIIKFESTCDSCGCFGPIIDNVCIYSPTCRCDYVILPTPTPTATSTITPTKTITRTPEPTPSNTPTLTLTPTITSTLTPTPTETITSTPTQSLTPTITPTATDPTISRAYVANYGSNSISVIHSINQKLLNTLTGISKPIKLVTNNNKSLVYILSENSSALTTINTSTYAKSTINLTSNVLDFALNRDETITFGLTSTSIIIDINSTTLVVTIGSNNQKISYSYDGSSDKLYVFDIDKVYIVTLPVSSSDYATNNWSNSTYTLSLSSNYVCGSLNIEDSSLYIGLSNNTIKIYDISTNTPSLITTLNNGTDISDIAINRQNSDAYVLSSQSGIVNIIDTTTNSIKNTISLPSTLTTKIAITDNGSYFYVVDSDSSCVYSYYVSGGVLANTITVGSEPGSIILLNSINVTPTPTRSSTPTPTVTPTATITPTLTTTPTLTPTQSPVPPYIITQPTNQSSTQKLVGNGLATFEVIAGPSYNAYQWQLSTDNGSTWNNISNSNSSYLTLIDLTTRENANQYRVLISNSFGSLTSNSAILSVDGPTISFSQQPQDQIVDASDSVTFTLSVTESHTIG
jgi:DNA-binding beta-propeller fold protein YncE